MSTRLLSLFLSIPLLRATLLAVVAVVFGTTLALADVDPAVVGSWQGTVTTAQGSAKVTWEIRADGSYSFQSDNAAVVASHNGTVIFGNGQWISTAQDGVSDAGTYQSQGGVMMAVGKNGPVVWQRSSTTTAAVSPWPRPFGEKIARAESMARNWNGDAVLIEARLDRPEGAIPALPGEEFITSFTFFSPGKLERFLVMPGNPAGETFPGGSFNHLDRVPVPADTLEPEAAFGWARVMGMTDPVGRAELNTWQNPCATAAVAWTVWPVAADRAFTVPAGIALAVPMAARDALSSQQASLIAAVTNLLPPTHHAFSLIDATLRDGERSKGMTADLRLSFPQSGTSDAVAFQIYESHEAAAADFVKGGLSTKRTISYGDGLPQLEAVCSVSVGEKLVTACAHLGEQLPIIVVGLNFEPPREVSNTEYENIWDTRSAPLLRAGALYRRMVCGE